MKSHGVVFGRGIGRMLMPPLWPQREMRTAVVEKEVRAEKAQPRKLELVQRQITEEAIHMKQTWHCHSAFRIAAGEAKISVDPFLSDTRSRDDGWSGYVTGKNSTQGGDR